jgi:uncharacterized protein YuzE
METKLTLNTESFVNNCLVVANEMMKLSTRHIWADYDTEADVLYMSFRKPQRATETIEISDEILLRKDENEVVGITIMNASMQVPAK